VFRNLFSILAGSALVAATGYVVGSSAGLILALFVGAAVGCRDGLGPVPRRAMDVTLGVCALVMCALAAVGPAAAQTPEPPPTGLVAAIDTIVQLIVAAIVSAFLSWLYVRLEKWFGIKIDAGHRETLHSALTTAANLTLSRAAVAGRANLVEGVIQVWSGAREAIQHFGLDDKKIETMLRAKVQAADVVGLTEPTPGTAAIRLKKAEEKRAD
jgi:hypothetical protein